MTRGPRAAAGRRRALAALAGVLAAACVGSPAPPDRHFRLAVAPPARRATPALPGVLLVERPRADALARRTALVYVTDAGAPELRTRAYENWADSPTLLVQREIAAGLHAAGVAERVVTPEIRVEPDYRLDAELVRFEEQRGGAAPRVVVELAFVLVDERGRGVLLQESYREERVAPGADAADAVRAYDAALSAILARLAADLGARP